MTSSDNSIEYMLDPSHSRLTVFPIKELDIWEMYKKMQAAFWTAEEIDFSKDYEDFKKLSSNSQYFIKMVLAFFAASDTIVNMNLGKRFINEVTILEAQICYQFQTMIENIHSETYSLMIDNIIREKDEKDKLLNAIENYDCIKKKADWALKWVESEAPYVQRVIAFACVEGIFFSGSFAAIFWLKKQNVMPGLCDSNELISRDENMHTNFACLIKTKCTTQLSQEIVHEMFRDAVSVEKEFICESLPVSLLGMNDNLMSKYIEYVADRLLLTLGYEKIWNTANPLDFMESISMNGHSNFFETRPTQYQKAAVLNTGRDNVYDLHDDF
jgi:ribonucleotide reductase beta subunit family protein with ferritin-like domain